MTANVDIVDELAMREFTSTDTGMQRVLNDFFGVGGWAYDSSEDVWVAPDKDYKGPGRGFIVIRRGCSWFTAVLPDETLS
jgi:hypothetical protein